MPTGGPVIRPDDTVEDLWIGMLFEPFFGGLFVAATFAGRTDSPAGLLWALRAFIALFFWSFGSVTAAMCFRELRRRGNWVPPGVARRPWLAPAAYAALMLLAASAVLAGLVVWSQLVFGGRA
jgi:hypothetical protein